MSKIIAYTALLYGKSYLASAIRSIIDHVDEYWVLYSPVGSHGHSTPIPCPETEAELYACAEKAAGSKLRWQRGLWQWEGQQRDTIHQLVPDADLVLVLDSDEIWADGLPALAIDAAFGFGCRGLRLPFTHYWRSFYRGFTHDPAYPIRVINPHMPSSEATLGTALRINHMGYAQPEEITRYKLETHGHKNELRPGWFENVFLPNRQYDCHVVGSQYWLEVEEIDPWQYMPEWMKEHPFASLGLIP